MSLIKLAVQQISPPIIILNNKPDSTTGSSKTFNTRNVAATAAGALGGFGAQEVIENHLPKIGLKPFDKTKFSHRLGRRLGTAAGAFVGAASVYQYLKHKDKEKNNTNFLML